MRQIPFGALCVLLCVLLRVCLAPELWAARGLHVAWVLLCYPQPQEGMLKYLSKESVNRQMHM